MEEIMRILHVTKKYPEAIGGDSRYVAALENEQQDLGHEVFILTANCQEVKDKDNVLRFGLKDAANSWDKICLKRILSCICLFFVFPIVFFKIKPKVIHAHSQELGFIVSCWARIFKCPVVLTCHSVMFPYQDEGFFRRSLDYPLLKWGRFSAIITVDSGSLSHFFRRGLNNCVYLPVGVDETILQKRGIKNPGTAGKIRFLYVGRLEKVKGIDRLLKAAKLVLEKNNDFELTIVGDGSLAGRMRGMADELGLGQRVKFYGPVSDRQLLARIYADADIFVLPSSRERFPLVVLEAWAAKMALIAPSVGSIPDVCTHLENAYLVRPGEVSDLFLAMHTLMKDKSLREAMAENGQAQARERYSWKKINEQILKVYSH